MKLVETIVWKTLAWTGIEECSLWKDGLGWRITGESIGIWKKVPYMANYVVDCDNGWRTEHLTLESEQGGTKKSLTLSVEGNEWRSGSKDFPELRGCVDVDLQISPCTNMLPIRRLRPKVRETSKLVAAWVPFPSLKVQPLEQNYTNLGGNQYRYNSDNFMADIQVDRLGLPESYSGLWTRLATYQPSRKS